MCKKKNIRFIIKVINTLICIIKHIFMIFRKLQKLRSSILKVNKIVNNKYSIIINRKIIRTMSLAYLNILQIKVISSIHQFNKFHNSIMNKLINLRNFHLKTVINNLFQTIIQTFKYLNIFIKILTMISIQEEVK